MRLSLGVVFLLFTSGAVFSQISEQKKERKISLRLYNQIMMEAENGRLSYSLFNFSPSVSYETNNNHFHELMISDLTFKNGKPIEDYLGLFDSKIIKAGLGYSFNYNAIKSKRWNTFIGLGITYFSENIRKESTVSTYFPRWLHTNTIEAVLIPRLTFNISDKIYMDVNIPIKAYQLNRIDDRHDFTPFGSYQETTYNDAVFPNQYTVNVGVGLRF